MIWGILAILLLFAAVFAVWPVFREKTHMAKAEDHDLAVYRAQLKELHEDRDQGLITDSQFAASELEIKRRILRLGPDERQQSRTLPRTMPVLATLLTLVAAFLFYLERGAPTQPGMTAQRSVQPPVEAGEPSMENLLARLRSQLEATPDNIEGWTLLARSLATLGRHGEAVAAYGKLADLQPGNADWHVEKAEALVRMGNGAVSPAALLAFEQAAALAPGHPAPQFYFGLAASQAGNIERAHEIWTRLAETSDPDAPWMEPLRAQIAEAGQRLGIAPVLDQGTIDAAGDMTADERQAFIGSMVERLASRLQDNPDDLDGWLRLARARMTLGQREAALEALRHAAPLATGALAEQIRNDIAALETDG